MYKIPIKSYGQIKPSGIIRVFDGAFIPFAPDNTDYQQFKRDIAEGAELQDADGNVMSAEVVAEFLNTLE